MYNVLLRASIQVASYFILKQHGEAACITLLREYRSVTIYKLNTEGVICNQARLLGRADIHINSKW